ncbi:Sec1 family domain-containing protein 1 [Chelonia mydas]|uniref:Sec1 family domain-containing protein 1 n=1 Tax=Chelonia mydas TaxID=8469 RepID=M7BEV1_CHEMY|nr:Sec1 family domain-containing protein 1 [Chelonia mydas]
MLNFNVPPIKNSTGEPVWKVLIYDRFGQDIISPLLSVKELRDMGITLHLLLHSDRDPIPDVPAVYFVMPTEENIDRMCQDLRNQLYESYYLNFISAISRSKLEDIANAALGASAVTQVAKVFDQYLNFITLEDDMFVLCNQNKELISYRAINRPDITDTEMEAIMDTVVDSLFCFFVTLAVVPPPVTAQWRGHVSLNGTRSTVALPRHLRKRIAQLLHETFEEITEADYRDVREHINVLFRI